ncbi:hypothetical protein M426DRAFT_26941 [Hypoxylon sp. CI-4A]|nr:hypothetical protein M426DRAFT_26941 [Hypoxylon sp. CI-4A]
MCHYKKTTYQCNHTFTNPLPLRICQRRRDFGAGLEAAPCGEVATHARNNVRVPRPCRRCRERKQSLDARLGDVKSRMAGLRLELELRTRYQKCRERHLDEVGVVDCDDGSKKAESESDSSSKSREGEGKEGEEGGEEGKEKKKEVDLHHVLEEIAARNGTTTSEVVDGDNDDDDDPTAEFLKKKRLEKHAQLMMFWDYSPYIMTSDPCVN